jgi:hypothetical protein
MGKPTLIIDGDDFSTLEEFLLKVRDVLAPGAGDAWIHSLDALNDELYRGEERPEGDFVLLWKNSAVSKERLGHAETVRQLERILKICHPSNRERVRRRIEAARRLEGETVFDWILDVIGAHEEVELRLE